MTRQTIEPLTGADRTRRSLLAGAVATGVVAALHLALRNPRLTGWGLSASLVTFTGSLAATAGVDGATGVALVLAAQGAVAATVCWIALDRSAESSASAARTATRRRTPAAGCWT